MFQSFRIRSHRFGHYLFGTLVCIGIFFGAKLNLLEAQEAKNASVAGVWNVVADVDGLETKSTWMIEQSNDEVTGHFISEVDSKKRSIERISLDGKRVRLEFAFEYQSLGLSIVVNGNVDGDSFEGTYSASVNENELKSGAVKGQRKLAPKFAGTWESVATLPNGEELAGLFSITGENDSLSGTISGDSSETKLDKAVVDNDKLRMEFVLEADGQARNIVVEASLEGEDSLDGRWILLDGNGDEEATGDWIAKRNAEAFDGSTLESFRGYTTEAIGDGWSMTDGVLHFDGTKSGDVITKAEFGNCELEFDWKISEAGNSGVMYRVSLGDKKPYFTGPEYQVLDDAKHKDGKLESHRAGALYALYVPQNKTLKPVGEWNSSKIVLNGSSVEHWLNGSKVVEADFSSDDWNERVEASKFKKWKGFGKNKKGHFAFQDHGDPVWYRNIRIKPLD